MDLREASNRDIGIELRRRGVRFVLVIEAEDGDAAFLEGTGVSMFVSEPADLDIYFTMKLDSAARWIRSKQVELEFLDKKSGNNANNGNAPPPRVPDSRVKLTPQGKLVAYERALSGDEIPQIAADAGSEVACPQEVGKQYRFR